MCLYLPNVHIAYINLYSKLYTSPIVPPRHRRNVLYAIAHRPLSLSRRGRLVVVLVGMSLGHGLGSAVRSNLAAKLVAHLTELLPPWTLRSGSVKSSYCRTASSDFKGQRIHVTAFRCKIM